jgi:hypothetical protein
MDLTVGQVTMKSRVEPYEPSLLLDPAVPHPVGLETARVTVHAKGDYRLYEMDTTIEMQVLPQEWPRITYNQRQEGSEKRRREVLLGVRDGVPTASYRRDTRKGAPAGTRIWKAPTSREIPANSLDMLSAVYLVRTMMQQDQTELRLPVVDREHVWDMRVTKGGRKRMQVPAGTFDVVEISLEPAPHSEGIDADNLERFEGLFGIHGSIHLFVEERTGIPVRIQGDLPVGILTLAIDVELESYRGTPPAFAPVGQGPAR